MLNSMELTKLNQVDICEIDPNSLVNVSAVSIDTALPQTERLERYIEQIHNPYCFISGDIPVKICFSDTDKTLSQSLSDYFLRLRQK